MSKISTKKISDPYRMLNSKNRTWVDSLKIQGLRSGRSCKHPSDFLITLVSAIFVDYETFKPTKDTPSKKREKALKYVRDLYIYYNIKQPEHWSPIKRIEEVDISDVNNEGVYAFNKAIAGLMAYLSPTAEYLKSIEKDIEDRTSNCQNMQEEIKDIAKECLFYDEKIETIKKIMETSEDKELRDQILKIIKNEK